MATNNDNGKWGVVVEDQVVEVVEGNNDGDVKTTTIKKSSDGRCDEKSHSPNEQRRRREGDECMMVEEEEEEEKKEKNETKKYYPIFNQTKKKKKKNPYKKNPSMGGSDEDEAMMECDESPPPPAYSSLSHHNQSSGGETNKKNKKEIRNPHATTEKKQRGEDQEELTSSSSSSEKIDSRRREQQEEEEEGDSISDSCDPEFKKEQDKMYREYKEKKEEAERSRENDDLFSHSYDEDFKRKQERLFQEFNQKKQQRDERMRENDHSFSDSCDPEFKRKQEKMYREYNEKQQKEKQQKEKQQQRKRSPVRNPYKTSKPKTKDTHSEPQLKKNTKTQKQHQNNPKKFLKSTARSISPPRPRSLNPIALYQIPGSHPPNSFKLILSRGSVVDFSYPPNPSKSAIVNAANESCLGGGGVDGAISNAGGPLLLQDRRALKVTKVRRTVPQYDGPMGSFFGYFKGSSSSSNDMMEIEVDIRCPTGDAKITGGPSRRYGALGVPYVIHAVGPDYEDYDSELDLGDHMLRSAYRQSLERAREHQLEAVAFCLLSAGVFRGRRSLGYVMELGLEVIKDFDGYEELKEVHVCAFMVKEGRFLTRIAEDKLGLERLGSGGDDEEGDKYVEGRKYGRKVN